VVMLGGCGCEMSVAGARLDGRLAERLACPSSPFRRAPVWVFEFGECVSAVSRRDWILVWTRLEASAVGFSMLSRVQVRHRHNGAGQCARIL
jgi:hypothetical protein